MGTKVEEEGGGRRRAGGEEDDDDEEEDDDAASTISLDAGLIFASSFVLIHDDNMLAVVTCIRDRSLIADAAEPFATDSKYRPNMMIVNKSALVSKKVESGEMEKEGRERR